MLNFLNFMNNRPNSQDRFTTLTSSAQMSLIDGVTTPLDVDMLDEQNMSQIDFVVQNTPAKCKFKFGLHASNLDPAKEYPFQTVMVDEMFVPLLSEEAAPAFFDFMIGLFVSVDSYLSNQSKAERLFGFSYAPVSKKAGDGEFRLPGFAKYSPAENISFWANRDVTVDVLCKVMGNYTSRIGMSFPDVKMTCAILCPYNNIISGEADAGKSYVALEIANQQARSPGLYVTQDQTLSTPDERKIIRTIAAGKPYSAQIATIRVSDTAKIIATHALAQSYGALWCEMQDYMLPILGPVIAAASP